MNKDELVKLGLNPEQASSVLQLAKPLLDIKARMDAVSQELS